MIFCMRIFFLLDHLLFTHNSFLLSNLRICSHRNDVIENFGIKDTNPGAISSLDDKDRTSKKPSLSVVCHNWQL